MSEPEAAGALEAAGPLAPALAGVLAVVELLELLDEQAASSIAAPTAVIPNATRVARGLRLLCLPSRLKRFMRPRI